MPMGQAVNHLSGLAAFQGSAAQAAAQARQSQYLANAAAMHNQQLAMSKLMASPSFKFNDLSAERTNRAGMTRAQWLTSIEARIAMSRASQVPIGDGELAQWEAQADEWEAIYAR